MKKIEFARTIGVLANVAVLASILLLAYERSVAHTAVLAKGRNRDILPRPPLFLTCVRT